MPDLWRVLVVLIGAGLSVGLGSPLVRLVFRRVEREAGAAAAGDPRALDPQAPAHADGDAMTTRAAEGLLRGGKWIGRLERLAVYACLLVGYPSGIAVVLAIKGLARYPELRVQTSTAAAEIFIIGTLVSVLWASGCAGLVWWLNAEVLA